MTTDQVSTVDISEHAALHEAAEKVRGQIAELSKLLEVMEAKLREAVGTSTEARIGDRVVFTNRQTGTFASRRFVTEQPDLAEQYTELVPTLNTKRLAADHPDVYTSYRGRRFEWK